MTPALYRGLATLALPLISVYLALRRAAGKEDAARFGERLGVAGRRRPQGPLVWLHAASIGEALSVLRLIERIIDDYPGLHMLVTTGTVTSARLLADRLPARAFHQYAPVDRPAWVRRFLDHWRPDLALWVESEFWPDLVGASQARGTAMILVNARMSGKSFARWRRLPGLIRPLLAGFSLCLAQDEGEGERLRALGAPSVKAPGNLKFAAGPLPVDADELRRLTGMIGDRPMWVAASTHAGEERIAAEVHNMLEPDHAGLLTVIVPRHPSRGPGIAKALGADDRLIALRSAGQPVAPETGIYVADTLGELGLFYRLCGIAFLGGSLIPHGGQNLLEPARLGCAVIHGPHMGNFRAVVEEMRAAKANIEVADAAGLAAAVASLLANPELRTKHAKAAHRIAAAKDGVLDSVVRELAPFLDALAQGGARGAPAGTPSQDAGDTVDEETGRARA
ncbi:MAG: 3-deoxy-D-manno-octulosonic acid transferase [Alphaproteobacteria bacterium]